MTSLRVLLLIASLLLAGAVRGQSLVTITETGPRTARLNLVMLSEGYTASELAANKFKNDATTISNALLTTEPFKSYRPFFNVYGIAVASAESGADQGAAGGSRNTYFNATFNSYGIDRLLTIDSTGYSRATSLLNALVPERDIVLVIVNDSKYGGSGGSIAVTSTNPSAPEIAIHEIGHSFAGLGDEYDYDGSVPSEDPNTTQETRRSFIKWNHWINAGTPIPTAETSAYGNGLVGLFEGAAYNPTGWYRPTLTSKMNELGEPFYAVNEEAIVLSIYGRVSPLTSSSPASSTIAVSQPDQSLVFTVDGPSVAATAPAITVQWKLDGVVVAGQTGRTLTLLSNTVGNGTHSLVADVSDPTPKVRKDTANLLKDSRSWTLNLSNQGPAAPSNLAAMAKPDGKIDLSWTDNASDEGGFAIERATGTGAFAEIGRVASNVIVYTDSTATMGVSTKYRVHGINAADAGRFGLFSAVVTVVPEIAPARVSDPADVAVLQGQPASFTVQATGTLLRYQWRRNTVNVTGATKPTYALSSAQLVHAGMYDCVVSNDVGSYTSASALLAVNVAAQITLHPVSTTVLFDQPVTLSVQASGTATITFQWRKNTVDIPMATGSTFTINAPGTNDAASYDCRATNAFGSALSKAAMLTVLGPPAITTPPVNAMVARGQSVSFSVAAKGTAPLAYQWRKGGVPVAGATTTKLTITSAKDSDVASYDCVVSNGYGSTPSATATLSFTSAPTSDYRLAGDRAGAARWRWVQRYTGSSNDSATALYVTPGGQVQAGGRSLSTDGKLGTKALNKFDSWAALFSRDGSALGFSKLGVGVAFPSGSPWDGSGSLGPVDFIPTTMGASHYYTAVTPSLGSPASVLDEGNFTSTGLSGTPRTLFSTEHVSAMCGGPDGAVVMAGTSSSFGEAQVSFSSSTVSWKRRILGGPAPPSGSIYSGRSVCRLAGDKFAVCGFSSFDDTGTLTFENATGEAAVTATGAVRGNAYFLACYDATGKVLWTRVQSDPIHSVSAITGNEVWCAVTETRVSTTTETALKLNPATGATERRIAVEGANVIALAPCPDGDVAVIAGTGPAATTVQGYSQARSGFTVLRFSPANVLRWVLPVFGDTAAPPHLSAGADGALYAAVTLKGDGNTEFAGIAPFAMQARQSDAFIAAIGESPQITLPPANQMVALGQPLHLSVTAAGLAGTISHQWLKDGKVLTGKTTSTLDIAITKLTDAGTYSCKVTGNGGTVECARAIVNVVDTTARTLKAPLTKPLDLAVSASGTGLTYTWWKNGTRIFNVGGFASTTTAKMHIYAMSSLFADNYVCKVTGAGGTLDVPFVTAVMNPPLFSMPVVPASIVSGAFDLQLSATDAASFKVLNLPPGLIYSAVTGRITGKPTPATSKLVSVTAANAAGTSATLTFTINVVDLPAHLKGTHQGLLSGERPWLNDLDGLLTLTVSATGAVTGNLRTAIGTYTLVGSVDADPGTQTWSFRQRFVRTGKPALVLTVNSANAATNLFTGSLVEEPRPGDVASINGHRNIWSASNLATTHSGTYNATLQASAGMTGTPPLTPGTLKTIITLSTGVCAWSGKLGDNSVLSGSTCLSPTATVPVWQLLYSNQGQLMGSNTIASPAINGTLQWKRKQVGTGVFWSDAPTTVNGVKAP